MSSRHVTVTLNCLPGEQKLWLSSKRKRLNNLGRFSDFHSKVVYLKYANTKTNTSLWCTQVQTDYIKDSIYQSKTSFLVSSVSLSSSDAVAVLWSEWVWQQILMTGISSNWRMLALQTLQQSPNTRSVTDWDTQPRLCNQYNTHFVPFNDFSRSNSASPFLFVDLYC